MTLFHLCLYLKAGLKNIKWFWEELWQNQFKKRTLVCHIKVTTKGYGWKEKSSASVLRMGRQTLRCKYLLVKAVFTLELELRNSELCKIPLKISGDTFTTFRASHMIYMRNDTLSKKNQHFSLVRGNQHSNL